MHPTKKNPLYFHGANQPRRSLRTITSRSSPPCHRHMSPQLPRLSRLATDATNIVTLRDHTHAMPPT